MRMLTKKAFKVMEVIKAMASKRSKAFVKTISVRKAMKWTCAKKAMVTKNKAEKREKRQKRSNAEKAIMKRRAEKREKRHCFLYVQKAMFSFICLQPLYEGS